ncbi:MAG: hypothetical protein ACTSPY_17415 [Candidatus Helarchaeota archaeon]
MPFEEKIEKVYEIVLNQIEKMGKRIGEKDSMIEISKAELYDFGFSDDDIEFLTFKKRLLLKYKSDLDKNNIHDIIYEMASDYYYQKILTDKKIKQLKRLKELENLEL